jgi:GNAT superfamily N-acetyltransferase
VRQLLANQTAYAALPNMTPPFPLVRPGYRVEVLEACDAQRLQVLFEACADYAMLESGAPPASDAAVTEFEATPAGRMKGDKFMLGLLGSEDDIVGLIAADRGWPDDSCWWIGLLLMHPDKRGSGIARAFVEAFVVRVRSQGAQRVELAVFDENRHADRFWRALGFRHLRSTDPRIIGRKQHVLHVMTRPLDC